MGGPPFLVYPSPFASTMSQTLVLSRTADGYVPATANDKTLYERERGLLGANPLWTEDGIKRDGFSPLMRRLVAKGIRVRIAAPAKR